MPITIHFTSGGLVWPKVSEDCSIAKLLCGTTYEGEGILGIKRTL